MTEPVAAPALDQVARGRRSFLVTLVCVGLGAALLLLGSGRTWSTTTAGGGALPTVIVQLSGGELTPSSGVALLALAALAGLAATRRRGRVVIGMLLVLAGVAVGDAAVSFATSWSSSHGAGERIRSLVADRVGADGASTTAVTAWWVVTLIAGLLLVVGGVLTIVTSGSWPQMGRRYERRGGDEGPVRDVRPRSAWDQLDDGIDPTEDRAGGGPGDTTVDPTLGAGGQA